MESAHQFLQEMTLISKIKDAFLKAIFKLIHKEIFKILNIYLFMGIGDWGLGIGDWGLGQSPIPNPQSPIPNPQSPIPICHLCLDSMILIENIIIIINISIL